MLCSCLCLYVSLYKYVKENILHIYESTENDCA